MKTEAFSQKSARISDRKVGITKPSFLFIQEPTEKQPQCE